MNKCIDEQRLKDKDIIKGLECCYVRGSCEGCSYEYDKLLSANCIKALGYNALQLILKLKADVNNYRTRVGNQREELARLNERNNELNLLNKKASQEAIKEITDGLVTMFLNLNESLNCEDIVENIKRFSSRLTEGRENG
jgi:hypothetical protein